MKLLDADNKTGLILIGIGLLILLVGTLVGSTVGTGLIAVGVVMIVLGGIITGAFI